MAILVICEAFNDHFTASGHLFDSEAGQSSPAGWCFLFQPTLPRWCSVPFNFCSYTFCIEDPLHNWSKKATSADDRPHFSWFDCWANNSHTQSLHLSPYSRILFVNYLMNKGNGISCFRVFGKLEKSVVSLHKGSDSCNLDNYRPSSKVSCLAKLLESSIKPQPKELQTTRF